MFSVLAAGADELDSLSVHEIQKIEVRTVRTWQDTPVVSSTVDSETLRTRSFGDDIPYLLSSLPSVTASSESGLGIGATSLRIRGVDPTRISVTLNGVPMNDPESNVMYWYDSPDLVSSLSSIEVQRGAGTSVSGSGAFGAGISMASLPLSTRFEGRSEIAYGSYGSFKAGVMVNSGIMGGHWIIGARYSHVESDGYVDRSASRLNSYLLSAAYCGGRTMVKLLSTGGVSKVGLAYTGVTAEQLQTDRTYNPEGEIYGYVLQADGTYRYQLVGYHPDNDDNFTQINNQLILDHGFGKSWKLNVTAHYTYGDGYYENYKNDQKLYEYEIAVPGVERSNLIRRKKVHSSFGGVMASMTYSSARTDLAFGMSGNYFSALHDGTVSQLAACPWYPETEYYRNVVGKGDGAAFARIEWKASGRVLLYGDIQYRMVWYDIDGTNHNYDETAGCLQRLDEHHFYNFLNPRVGISYSPSDGHRMFLSAAYSSKEPTRQNFTDVADSTPSPEHMVDLEAGYCFRNETLDLKVNLYYMLYRDQLVETGELSDTGNLVARNVGSSYRRGIELDLRVRCARWLTLFGNATLSQNRISDYVEYVDGVPFEIGESNISFSPEQMLRCGLEVRTHGFEASFSTSYTAMQYVTNGSHADLSLPSYTVSDLLLGYRLRLRGERSLRFGLRIANMFNAMYCSSGYGSSYLTGGERLSWMYYFPQAGINVMGSVAVEF